MKRKMLAWILAAAMTATSVPANVVTAFAAESVTEEAELSTEELADESEETPPVLDEDSTSYEEQNAAVANTAEEAGGGDLFAGDSSDAATAQDGIDLEEETQAETEKISEKEIAAEAETPSEPGVVEEGAALVEDDQIVADDQLMTETASEAAIEDAEDIPEDETEDQKAPEVPDNMVLSPGGSVSYDAGAETKAYLKLKIAQDGYYAIDWEYIGNAWFNGNLYQIMSDGTLKEVGVNLSVVKTYTPEGASTFIGVKEVSLSSGEYLLELNNGYESQTGLGSGTVSLKTVSADPDSARTLTLWEKQEFVIPAGSATEQYYRFTPEVDGKYQLEIRGGSKGGMEVTYYNPETLEKLDLPGWGYASLKAGTEYKISVFGMAEDDADSQITVEMQSAPEKVTLQDFTINTLELSTALQDQEIGQLTYAGGYVVPIKIGNVSKEDDGVHIELMYQAGSNFWNYGGKLVIVGSDGQNSYAFPSENGVLNAGSYQVKAEFEFYDPEPFTITSDAAVTMTVQSVPEIPDSAVLRDNSSITLTVDANSKAYFKIAPEHTYDYQLDGLDYRGGVYQKTEAGFSQLDAGDSDRPDVGLYYLEQGKEYIGFVQNDQNNPDTYIIYMHSPIAEMQQAATTAEELTENEQKVVYWKDPYKDEVKYYRFHVETPGQYEFQYAGGYIYTYVYEIAALKEGKLSSVPEDYSGASPKYDLEDSKDYLLKLCYGSGSADATATLLTLTASTSGELDGAELQYTGPSKAPEFIEGLTPERRGFPFSYVGQLDAVFTYTGNKKKETVSDVSGDIETSSASYSLIATDKDGNERWYSFDELPAGDWYAVINYYNWGLDDKGVILPKPGSDGSVETLDEASYVPFKVLTKQEAAKTVLDSDSVSLNPNGTYYVGFSFTPSADGNYQFSSDLDLAEVIVYPGEKDQNNQEPEIGTAKKSNSIFTVQLTGGKTYYIFVRPSKAEKFTISQEKTVKVRSRIVTTSIEKPVRAYIDPVSASDFGMELTYDDGKKMTLTGSEKDQEGITYQYHAEGSDNSYSFNTWTGAQTLAPGDYSVSAKGMLSGSYIDSSATSDNTLTLKVEGNEEEAPAIEENRIEKVPAGEGALYKFVPTESGYYHILENGRVSTYKFLKKENEGLQEIDPIRWNVSAFWLQTGETYYIRANAKNVSYSVAAVKEIPLMIPESGKKTTVKTITNGMEILFSVEKEGQYILNKKLTDGKDDSYGYHELLKLNGGAEWETVSEDDNGAYTLKAGETYLYYYESYGTSSDLCTYEFSVKPYSKQESDLDAVKVEMICSDTVDLPPLFAKARVEDYIKVKETKESETNTLSPYQKSSLTDNVYEVDVDGDGKSKVITIKTNYHIYQSKVVTFTGDLSKTPVITENQKFNVSSGQLMEGSRYFRFVPTITGIYNLNLDAAVDGEADVLTILSEDGETLDGMMKMTAGKNYYISVTDRTATLQINQVKGVSKISITDHPVSVLRQEIDDVTGIKVHVIYVDKSEADYTLNGTGQGADFDKYGNNFLKTGSLLPSDDGNIKEAEIRVSLDGRSTSVVLPLKQASELPAIAEGKDAATTIKHETGKRYYWYRFTPSENAAYSYMATEVEGTYAVEGTLYDGAKEIELPAELKAGKTYLLKFLLVGNKTEEKVWMQKQEEKDDGIPTLHYEFVSSDTSKELPVEVKALAPADVEYIAGTTVKAEDPIKKEYSVYDGTWFFKAYDQDSVLLDTDKTITGTWEFKAIPTHEVKFTDKVQEGTNVPADAEDSLEAAVTGLPVSEIHCEGQKFTLSDPESKIFETKHGYWTFAGYSVTGEHTMGTEDLPVERFWTYEEEKHTVSYVFKSGTEGKELPAEVTALLPEAEATRKGDAFTAAKPEKDKVSVDEGIWRFEGYDLTSIEKITADVKVVGTWNFSDRDENTAQAYEDIGKSEDTSAQDVVDKLNLDDDKVSSDKVLENLEKQAEKDGADDDQVVSKLAEQTQNVDDALTTDDPENKDESKKIVSGVDGEGAYIGSTVPAEVTTDKGSKITVNVSGAAATVANEIKKDTEDNKLKDDSVYRAEVVVSQPVEKTNDDGNQQLEMDISMKVKVDGEQSSEEPVEPVRPVSVTMDVPAEYDGFELAVFHDGKEVRFSVKDGKIIFTVSGFSPFTIEAKGYNLSAISEAEKAIRAIGDVTSIDAKERVEAAKKAYQELVPAAQKRVTNADKLTEAQNQIKNLEDAKAVTDAVNALGNLTLSSEQAVANARKLYNGLSEDAKKLVSAETVNKLATAESTISTLKAEKAKQDAAKAAAAKAAAERAAAAAAAAAKPVSHPTLPAASVPLRAKQKSKVISVGGIAAGDRVVSVTSSNTTLVKVTQVGNGFTLKGGKKKKGTATITVRLASGKTVSMKVKLQKKKVRTKKITISCARKLTLTKGQTVSIGASIAPITTVDKLKYTSSKKKVASVSRQGVIKAKKKGKAVITVKSGGKKIKIKVTVK